MKSYLIGHLKDYNNVINIFQVGDWFATSGNTGLSTGPHAHFGASVSGDKLENHFRGNHGICDPSDIPVDTSGKHITLEYQATDAPYSPSKPHTGIDWSFNYDKIIATKKIRITDFGTHPDFGNYIIFVIDESQGSTPNNTFAVVRSGKDAGTYTFDNKYRNRFVSRGGKYILNQSTNDTNGSTWGENTLFDSIISKNNTQPTPGKNPNDGNFRAVRPDGEIARFRDEYASRLVLQSNGMYKLNQDTPQCDTNNNNLPSSENWLAGSVFHYTINDEA